MPEGIGYPEVQRAPVNPLGSNAQTAGNPFSLDMLNTLGEMVFGAPAAAGELPDNVIGFPGARARPVEGGAAGGTNRLVTNPPRTTQKQDNVVSQMDVFKRQAAKQRERAAADKTKAADELRAKQVDNDRRVYLARQRLADEGASKRPVPPPPAARQGAGPREAEAVFAAENALAQVAAKNSARQKAAASFMKARTRPREVDADMMAEQGLQFGARSVSRTGHIKEPIGNATVITNPTNNAARIDVQGVKIPFQDRSSALRFLKQRQGDPLTKQQADLFASLQNRRLGLEKQGAKDPFNE